MAADLSDELILEIVVRLPLKHAIQCSLLNKTFFHWISDPIFQRRLLSSFRSSNSSIFYCSSSNILTRITPEISSGGISRVSKTLPLQLSVLASCNGVLLLCLHCSYYVLNPITGGIMFVDYPLHRIYSIGLAVDLDAQSFHFKLVEVDKKFMLSSERSIVTFSVVVPSSSGGFVLKSSLEFVCESFLHSHSQAVYAHGCLHWLGEEGKQIIVFDVEKEKARIINGPVDNNELSLEHVGLLNWFACVDKWFGFADGSLQFVYRLMEEIVIKSHDYVKDEWQVKHKIANIYSPTNCQIFGCITLFFDGQRLFLVPSEGDRMVRMYDISSDKWAKTEKIGGRDELFFSFSPTLAKVSDKYVHNSKIKIPAEESLELFYYTELKSSFSELQHFLMES